MPRETTPLDDATRDAHTASRNDARSPSGTRDGDDYKLIGWNVDTQYGFMEEGRNLYVPGSGSIRDSLERLTDTLRAEGYQIVHTGDLHTPDDDEIVPPGHGEPDDRETFPPHCMADDADPGYTAPGGADHIPETAPRDAVAFDWRDDPDPVALEGVADGREAVIYKNRFDVFQGSPYTDDVLDAADPDGVLVYGVTTDVCVDRAVRGLLERGHDVYVVEDAIHELNPEEPETAEAAMADWQEDGAHLVTTDEVVDALEA